MERNLTMLMDFYELTMANGYFKKGYKDTKVVFDMFYRKNPDDGGFVIFAGLEQFIDYLLNMKFTDSDIEYLRSRKIFDEEFLTYLKNFKFTGDVYSVKEGEVVYPNTPLVTIVAPICEAQLIETMLLLTINHQSLIATKANRIVRAARGKTVMEFGARRAHGYDAAIYGSRACYIGGVDSTATVSADIAFKIKAVGTMAHSWIQFFDNEYEAFKAYAEIYPTNCVLLIDTYNVLESGIKNAIRVAKEVLEPKGYRLKGVRIDSGDLAYLSKKVRKILDENNLNDCQIIVSNSIDEYLLESLFSQGAKIDSFGVGERMITSKSEPVFGGVYKLVGVKTKNKYIPKIKISENSEKITNPGYKKLYRVYDENGMAIFDFLALHNEKINKDIKLIYPLKDYKYYEIEEDWSIKELQLHYVKNGKLNIKLPTLDEIRDYAKEALSKTWNEEKRFDNPHVHFVDLTEKLYHLKEKLLEEENKKICI